MSSFMRNVNLSQMKPPNVEITVHNLSDCPFFRTHDTINGEVIFTPRQQTSVEDISIEFTGEYQLREP